jgi:hypothetical protein
MNRAHWKDLLPIITAFANGERVEMVTPKLGWLADEVYAFDSLPENYRIAPRTIRIGNYDVPEPYRGEMEMEIGDTYFVTNLTNPDLHLEYQWDDDNADELHMKRGLIHLTPEAAALHGKALASLTAGEGVRL